MSPKLLTCIKITAQPTHFKVDLCFFGSPLQVTVECLGGYIKDLRVSENNLKHFFRKNNLSLDVRSRHSWEVLYNNSPVLDLTPQKKGFRITTGKYSKNSYNQIIKEFIQISLNEYLILTALNKYSLPG